ncbi:hypothetical protein JOC54_003167 [Alkalihalobacillus xiaoxiensis]|uniref:Lipoprotein n=1 Tax=Shouchella xiaoxiensis TaxID=766895 RepID=A0ABS2SWH8_9BACI|nr:hypothetical protein [Shouchella xiaoxiensis]MBM7839887.1 hypothetical protein [Shouchella xiaoxiensis]
MKLLKIVVFCSLLGIVGGCSSSAQEISNADVMNALTSEEAPKIYDDENYVKDFIEDKNLDKVTEIDGYESETVWSMESNSDEAVHRFEFYLGKLDEEISPQEAYDFLLGFIPKEMYEHFVTGQEMKYEGSAEEVNYYINLQQEDLENPLEDIPNVLHLHIHMEGDHVLTARFGKSSPRRADVKEELEWDLN